MSDNVNNDIELESNVTKTYTAFEDMDLSEDLLRGVLGFNYKVPSAIQSRGIMPMVEGRDMIAQAQSGTGKTGCFAIGILQRCINLPPQRNPKALILAPTRELALQSCRVIKGMTHFCKVNVHVAVGGSSVDQDLRAVRSGTDIIVATPGRAKHLLEKTNMGADLKVMCLDEADQLLTGNFTEQIADILKSTNQDVQIILVSATMPPEVQEMTQQLMREPAKILVKAEELTLEGIRQFFVDCNSNDEKYEVIRGMYASFSISSCITFVNTRTGAIDLAKRLEDDGHAVGVIHGELDVSERRTVFETFVKGATRHLVTTDLMARGIDVQSVGLVINYDIPISLETYLHRIGRSGRYGRKGVAVNLITERDFDKMEEIALHYATEILPFPDDPSQIL